MTSLPPWHLFTKASSLPSDFDSFGSSLTLLKFALERNADTSLRLMATYYYFIFMTVLTGFSLGAA